MAETIDYEERWRDLLNKAAGGNRNELDDMPSEKATKAVKWAFVRFLLACYGDQVKRELGPALTPESDRDVLRMKAVALHHWKFSEVKGLSDSGLIAALNDELAHFKLPHEACQTVEPLLHRNRVLKAALDHHRPAEAAIR